MRALVAVFALVAAAVPAMAHDWYTGQKNEIGQSCCGGYDCGQIPMNRVRRVEGGYEVTLYAGDLPTLTAEDRVVEMGTFGGTAIYPGIGTGPVIFHFEGNPGTSPDGFAHACVVAGEVTARRIRCLFLGGSV